MSVMFKFSSHFFEKSISSPRQSGCRPSRKVCPDPLVLLSRLQGFKRVLENGGCGMLTDSPFNSNPFQRGHTEGYSPGQVRYGQAGGSYSEEA